MREKQTNYCDECLKGSECKPCQTCTNTEDSVCSRESLQSRITELEQRLASKEDALAAALLVVDEASKRVADQVKNAEQGFIRGIYMSACYCHEDHVCSPCTIKSDIYVSSVLADARQLAEAQKRHHMAHHRGYSFSECGHPFCQTARRVLA